MEVNRRRKARDKTKKSKKMYIIKKSIANCILLIIVFFLSYMLCGIYEESKVRTISSSDSIEYSKIFDNTENMLNVVNEEKSKTKIKILPVDKKYKGYEVDSRLEIPKIKLNTNVLSQYSEKGLDICVSKYYGPSANQVGNYCVAGHNYNKDNMFNHLIELDIGDSVFLSDNENGKIEYEIYDIYKVKPHNINPLSQNTKGKKEITLITCVNYSRNRLVIKATEKI